MYLMVVIMIDKILNNEILFYLYTGACMILFLLFCYTIKGVTYGYL